MFTPGAGMVFKDLPYTLVWAHNDRASSAAEGGKLSVISLVMDY